jgi:hypothetical protein
MNKGVNSIPLFELYGKRISVIMRDEIIKGKKFNLSMETVKHTKKIIISQKKFTDTDEYEPSLFISINTRTGIAKAYSVSEFYTKYAQLLKTEMEALYKIEKIKYIF